MLNVLGLISIDTLTFEGYKSYLGGGALSTAWIASLWQIPTTLYSTAFHKELSDIIARNLLWNTGLFSHIALSTHLPMTTFEISQCNDDYLYKIAHMHDFHNQLEYFLKCANGEQYIKLPATNFSNIEKLLTSASINPQGTFDLIDFTRKIHTDGFIFLNCKELLAASKGDLSTSLKLVQSTGQSFVVTLGARGSICYDATESAWHFCPSILSTQYNSSLGCGDAFAGGFLAAKVKMHAIDDCMLYGTISAYLATYSPSNMVTAWITSPSEDAKFENIKQAIAHFSTFDEVLVFLQSHNSSSSLLNPPPCISNMFDWELKGD